MAFPLGAQKWIDCDGREKKRDKEPPRIDCYCRVGRMSGEGGQQFFFLLLEPSPASPSAIFILCLF